MNPEVDWFFDKVTPWREAYSELRQMALASGLREELKWGCPCYTRGTNNIVLIHGFKEYCALLFMQGALLKDPKKLLTQQTQNVQAQRQFRFRNMEEILKYKSSIKTFIKDAIALDKSGVKVKLKKTTAYEVPKTFKKALGAMPELKKAFQALTPGRQRGYLLYFAAAKQEKTREARVEKYIPKILKGKGLED
jgi:uncharacterized protein YdeI (YjbR/CyaY-like superfamily)